MSEKKHYHPIAILMAVVKQIRSWLFLVVIILFQGNIYGIFGLLIGSLLGMVLILIIYHNQYYQLTPDHLVVSSGVINKKETMIPYERIQTIKQEQWFFFKPFGVVRLAIETAGGVSGEAEAVLSAVPKTVLTQIEAHQQEQHFAEEYQRLYEVSNGQIVLFSLTNSSIFAGIFAIVAIIEQGFLDKWEEKIWDLVAQIFSSGWFIISLIIASGFTFFSVIAIIRNFIRYHRFRVTRHKDILTIESGLFERKVQKIPIGKIQGLKIHQALLRKLFGLASVEVLLAGGQEMEEELSELFILPIIQEQQIIPVLDFLLPEWTLTKLDIQYTSRKKMWYFFRIPVLVLSPLIFISVFFSPLLSLILGVILLVLVGLAFIMGYFQGYWIQEKQICFQNYRVFTKIQTIIHSSKVQAFSQKTSKWLYNKKTGHVTLHFKVGAIGSSMSLKFISCSHIESLYTIFKKEISLTSLSKKNS